MKAVVVYDSIYGNTEKIAKSVAEGIGSETQVLRAEDLNNSSLPGLQILVIGSPVHGGRATEKLQSFLKGIEENGLRSVGVTAFDTRFEKSKQGFGLKALMSVIGFAADKIINTLISKGGIKLIDPEGFFVEGEKGPLKQGELERAKEWGHKLTTNLANIT